MESNKDTIPAGATIADGASATAHARRRWVWGVLGALVVLALVALGLLISVWRHPSAFPEAGGWGVETRHGEINEPLFVGMTYPDEDAEGTVSIDKVKGNAVTDTAAAELAYFVCTIDTAAEYHFGTGGQPDVDEVCSTLTPAAGDTLSLGNDPREQLLLEVTPTRQGVVKILGLDVTYTHGWQHGTQRIGGEVKVRAVGSQR